MSSTRRPWARCIGTFEVPCCRLDTGRFCAHAPSLHLRQFDDDADAATVVDSPTEEHLGHATAVATGNLHADLEEATGGVRPIRPVLDLAVNLEPVRQGAPDQCVTHHSLPFAAARLLVQFSYSTCTNLPSTLRRSSVFSATSSSAIASEMMAARSARASRASDGRVNVPAPICSRRS